MNMSMNDTIKKAEDHLLHTYNRYPIVFDHADGVRLYDADGKELARQKGIPFLKDQVSGIGDVAREVRPMYGIFRFYTLYKHFADALTVLDNLPVSNQPEEE